MNAEDTAKYELIGVGGIGFYPQKRGLIEVSGREAVQFLNGLITNDVGKLEDGAQMLAAFPNAQGRLLAIVRVRRRGDKFLFETEGATHEKVHQNLFRFTFAGDFFVEDLSEIYESFLISNLKSEISDAIRFDDRFGSIVFVPKDKADDFKNELKNAVEISNELFEILRIERGVPLYGVDADETTIVPELGLDGLISYNKGCYIGQEIIARIHFRGHVAKQLTGLIFESRESGVESRELKSADDKNAGRITSVCFSPKLGKTIALAYVRYDFLAEGTELKANEINTTVKNLPFVE